MTTTPSPEALADRIAAASADVERLSRELDITNADHIALWLEANMQDSPLGWLACRIVEAHEAVLANPPRHRYWGAGEPDCPRDILASNGELHTLRCKVCGNEDARNQICRTPRDHRLAFSRPEPVGDEALVERVARAIYEAEPPPSGMEAVFGYDAQKALNGPDWVVYAKARAAIQAIPAPATDAGLEADSLVEDAATLEVFLAAYEAESDGEVLASVIVPEDDLLTLGALRRILASLPKSPSAGEEA